MKTYEITASNKQGLFVGETNISELVVVETPVKFTANGCELVVTGYNPRNFHRKDSSFEYFVEGVTKGKPNEKGTHGHMCAKLKELLGFDADKRTPPTFTFEVKHLDRATDEQLEELAKQIKELQTERKQATKRKADVEKKLGVKLTEEQYKAMTLVGLA
jgi:hypothetical protein